MLDFSTHAMATRYARERKTCPDWKIISSAAEQKKINRFVSSPSIDTSLLLFDGLEFFLFFFYFFLPPFDESLAVITCADHLFHFVFEFFFFGSHSFFLVWCAFTAIPSAARPFKFCVRDRIRFNFVSKIGENRVYNLTHERHKDCCEDTQLTPWHSQLILLLCGFVTVWLCRKSQSIASNCLSRAFFFVLFYLSFGRSTIRVFGAGWILTATSVPFAPTGFFLFIKYRVLICVPLPVSTLNHTHIKYINDAGSSKTQTVCPEQEFISMLRSYLLHPLTKGGSFALAQR